MGDVNSLTANFNLMTTVARRAGNALLRDFAEVQSLTTSRAGTGRLANRARQRADTSIRRDLAEARPHYGIRSDVIGTVEGADPTRDWLVSAIAGYANFRNGIPHWAVAIALTEKGDLRLAVLYDSYKDEMFRSQKGQGAYLNSVRLRCAPRTEARGFLVTVDPIGHAALNLGRLANRVQSVRCSGAPALDLTYLAGGRIHGFLGTGRDAIDRITAEAILLESGGMTGTAPFFPDGSGLFCAAGTDGYEPFLAALEDVVEPDPA